MIKLLQQCKIIKPISLIIRPTNINVGAEESLNESSKEHFVSTKEG